MAEPIINAATTADAPPFVEASLHADLSNGLAGNEAAGAALNQDDLCDGLENFDLPDQPPAAAASKDDAFPADQIAAMLDSALERQKKELLSVFKDQLSTINPTPFASIKRKADKISNDGIKKQFIPLEDTKLRLDAVRTTITGVAKGDTGPIGPAEAVQLKKTLDEGIDLVQKRMHFLEIAEVEGWSVAKCLEKNALSLKLLDDMQKQLKRAKKDAKMEEGEKKEKKKNQNRRGFHARRGGRGGRGGQHAGGFGGF